ncbi:MAG TPA: DUF4382 domain-containing protein [Longimicrobiales bacterium]|nr:DUF4382 domain-containing protein [Longimicrobiales bacterium]
MSRKLLSTMALALLLPLAACDDGTGAEGPGTLSLLLTDAPGDFVSAIVTVDRVELVGDEDGIVVLRDEPFTEDLILLQNDAAEIVGPVTVPDGLYSQLRFIVSGGCIVVEGETGDMVYASSGYTECGEADGNLQMPSFSQSGVKVNLPGGAIQLSGEDQVLLLDWDVSQSFGHQAGNSGMWVMHPVIHAENISLSGSITVELTAADTVVLPEVDPDGEGGNDPRPATLADFQARLGYDADDDGILDSEEVMALTATTTEGLYAATFFFVIPRDDYEVSVELMDGVVFEFTVDPESPQPVDLPSGGTATVSFEVTSPGPPPAT